VRRKRTLARLARYNVVVTTSSPAVDSQAACDSIPTTLDRDLFCFACGYNLRGLSSEGSCPECAAPVSKSVQGETLAAAADPRWLRRLRIGIVLLLLAPLVSLAGALPGVRGRQLLIIAGLCSPETYRLLLVEELFQPGRLALLLPAGSVLTASAVWLLTARWPWVRHDPRTTRLGLRGLAILGAGMGIAFYIARTHSFTSIARSAGPFMLPSTALDVLQAGLLLHYCCNLARRSRDVRLPARFTLLCILAIARMAIIFGALCVFFWRTSVYFPVFMVMVIVSLVAAPVLAGLEAWCFIRLWRTTRRAR
jgi:hypothetical protein